MVVFLVVSWVSSWDYFSTDSHSYFDNNAAVTKAKHTVHCRINMMMRLSRDIRVCSHTVDFPLFY